MGRHTVLAALRVPGAGTSALRASTVPDVGETAKPARAPPLRVEDDLDMVFDLIASVYAGRSNRYAALARDAVVTRRTAQHWLSREHAPRLPHVFRLLYTNVEFRVAFLAMLARMEMKR